LSILFKKTKKRKRRKEIKITTPKKAKMPVLRLMMKILRITMKIVKKNHENQLKIEQKKKR